MLKFSKKRKITLRIINVFGASFKLSVCETGRPRSIIEKSMRRKDMFFVFFLKGKKKILSYFSKIANARQKIYFNTREFLLSRSHLTPEDQSNKLRLQILCISHLPLRCCHHTIIWHEA